MAILTDPEVERINAIDSRTREIGLGTKINSLSTTTNGEGASLIGIEDSGALITATDVEGALAENRAAIDAIEANVDQDVSSGASPTLDGANLTGLGYASVDPQANTVVGQVLHVMATTAGGGNDTASTTIPTGTWDLVDVWGKLKGAGDTSDTLQISDGTGNITDAIDASGADNTRLAWTTFDDALAKGLVGGTDTLDAVHTDNAGSDAPAIDVHYLLRRVA